MRSIKSIHSFFNFARDVVAQVWFWLVVWGLLVVLAAVGLWLKAPEWLTQNESGSATIRNLLLGIATLIALPLGIWRSMVAERQADAAQRQSLTASGSLLNQRYQKGAEMLGSDVLSVRMGGIFALASLAEEHPNQYHVQIMRLLCLFIRHPSASGPTDFEVDRIYPHHEPHGTSGVVRADTQAAMKAVLGRSERLRALEALSNFRLDLRGANLHQLRWNEFEFVNLRGADLSYANLEGVDFGAWAFIHEDSIDFSRVILFETNLSNTNLRGTTGLTQLQLTGACAESGAPPALKGLVDAQSGAPLQWPVDAA